MSNNVKIELNEEIFLRLQSLAIPLVDTTSTVIERVLNEWEQLKKGGVSQTPSSTKPEKGFFRTTRGIQIPCGKLRATYRKRGSSEASIFHAQVTSKGIDFNGHTFDDPSPAGISAKKSAGAQGAAASTNGWEFWEYYNVDKKEWISIDIFRKKRIFSEITLDDIGL